MKTKLKMDLDVVKKFIINEPSNSKIYMGCDSSIFRKNKEWWAEYVTVVVIHKGGKHGCKIFGEVVEERDYVDDKKKPILRLLNEAIKTASLYEELKESIGQRYRELHLDINPDEHHNSHLALSQAVGYIRGVCGINPKIKPDAFAASSCADRFMRVKNYDITLCDMDGFNRTFKRKVV
jgi:predicted RNase H-related nuclease YkuK (DUF458 family)